MSSSEAKQTACDIFRCQLFSKARENIGHPCHRIVASQTYGHQQDLWQVPEPWRGNIEVSPLLFVSSNPSIDPLDDAPWNDQSDFAIDHYYRSGTISIVFPKALSAAGRPSKRPVAFWASLHKRAEEIFGKTGLTPGADYSLTEVVHCKSRDELGVDEALQTCTKQHLSRVLGICGARVIVCLGTKAHGAVVKEMQQVKFKNSEPLILQIPHPNARVRRTAAAVLSATQLKLAHDALSGE